jgi:hypothetical protein
MCVRLPPFQIGQLKVKGQIARLQTADDSFNDKPAGKIGADVLQYFDITIDCLHAVRYLEKTQMWNKPAAFNRTHLEKPPE